jgi:hypothetical protein
MTPFEIISSLTTPYNKHLELGIKPTELRLLGSSWTNDLAFEVEKTDTLVSIIPAKHIRRSVMMMTIFLIMLASGVSGLIIWANLRYGQNTNYSPALYILFAFIWCFVVFGPYFMNRYRIRHLEERSPLLAYNKNTDFISIYADSAQWKKSDILGLVGFSTINPFSETSSELQLIVREGKEVRQYLITTSISGYARLIYGDQIQRFCAVVGVPGYIVTHKMKKSQLIAEVEKI